MAHDKGDRIVNVACVQMRPEVGNKAKNVARSIECIEQAVGDGAQLVVLPELCNSGYVFENMEEAVALSEPVPGGESCNTWSGLAAKLNVHIVAGINERDGDDLFNSSVVIGPSGHLATYRKVHLWNNENLFFKPGNLGFPVVDTPVGKLGTFICYDTWFSESYRLCAVQGADIICLPTNWVPIPGQDPNREAMANILCMAAAHTNGVFVAAADRVGEERGQPFIGQSLIVSHTGWPIGGPASFDSEEIIHANCNLDDARRHRVWNKHNRVLHDRRTDIYGETLGADVTPSDY
tara:strand:+ start:865 stop:1743 length:879 start_codon:yes stop_codon:yes gene_type:complete